MTGARPTDRALAVPATPASGRDASRFDPSRGVVADIILERLTKAQSAFILRMRPHQRQQVMNSAEWNAVDCCVDSGIEWPDVYWFGGMRLNWVLGRRQIRFQFNEVGLEVRNRLAQAIETRSAETTGSVGVADESAVPQGMRPSAPGDSQ